MPNLIAFLRSRRERGLDPAGIADDRGWRLIGLVAAWSRAERSVPVPFVPIRS